MPEVLSGTQPGTSANDLVALLADDLGYKPENSRFANKVIRWANSVIRKIQLKDPQNRRTMVHDADWNMVADQVEYDTRASTDLGGLGFTNLHEVVNVVCPSISDLPMELVSLDKWRHRGGFITEVSGQPGTIILLDSWRFRIDPIPDQAYAAKMDFRQTIPQITAGTGKVEWPEPWDEVLLEGTKYEAYKVHHKEFPAVWMTQKKIFDELFEDLTGGEQVTGERPRAVVNTRYRGRRTVRHDRSADTRWRY